MVSDTKYVRGAERLGTRIETIRRKLSLPPLLNEIGDLLLKRTLDRFDREVDPDGRPWKELALATLDTKRRLGYENQGKLKRTLALRKSIRKIQSANAGAVYFNTGAQVRIGIADPEIAVYARVQNEGNGKIPARRFLGIGALDVKSVDSYLRRKGQDAVESE